jgi:hypothetical protein
LCNFAFQLDSRCIGRDRRRIALRWPRILTRYV